MPFRKLFLSRWSALLWAAGILWTAVDVAGFSPSPSGNANIIADNAADATGVSVNASDLALFANVMKGD